jgi:hypothetical protein
VTSRRLLALALCAALTGCGGSSGSTTHLRGVAQTRQCQGSKEAAKRERQQKKLIADLHKLRAAAATVKGHTQNGNDALNDALDRFMIDVAEESLPVYRRSRFIDLAAAIVAPRCYLCFQALESNRPVAAGAKLACG